MHQPVRYFRLLRYYELNLISHKLHLLQERLEENPIMGLSYQESQELTKLLQDQGILSIPDDSGLF